MIFRETNIKGLYEIALERHSDARGSFARTFCEDEFAQAGLPTHFVQANSSVNVRAGTLRGMHFQRPPHEEGKLVRCVRGAIHDVVIDIRPQSPSFRQSLSFRLDCRENFSLYIPAGCAHGFQTLEDDSEVLYEMTTRHSAAYASGFRYDDPGFALSWPLPITMISEKDLAWPALESAGQ
ncbi:dTDP-4-dehydrorhamnose 3,5-epimerase family protein [Lichenicoccus sp.]|uniref:dTDP-4-dehydrorhamnose 3,5-epimerase family protein n=1 Tax=Lichenicoccus sp. TaxID=2781899 RepID=UPI003D09AA4E